MHSGAVADDDIALTHASTATDATARQMTRAFLGYALRQTRFRLTCLILLLLVSGPVFLAYAGDGLSPVARVLGSLFWATVFTVAILGVFCALVWFPNLRNFRRTVPAGSVQRTGFGEEGFATANALSSSRFTYKAVHSIYTHREFVLIRFVGSPVVRVYPASLFPADAIARIRAAAG